MARRAGGVSDAPGPPGPAIYRQVKLPLKTTQKQHLFCALIDQNNLFRFFMEPVQAEVQN